MRAAHSVGRPISEIDNARGAQTNPMNFSVSVIEESFVVGCDEPFQAVFDASFSISPAL